METLKDALQAYLEQQTREVWQRLIEFNINPYRPSQAIEQGIAQIHLELFWDYQYFCLLLDQCENYLLQDLFTAFQNNPRPTFPSVKVNSPTVKADLDIAELFENFMKSSHYERLSKKSLAGLADSSS